MSEAQLGIETIVDKSFLNGKTSLVLSKICGLRGLDFRSPEIDVVIQLVDKTLYNCYCVRKSLFMLDWEKIALSAVLKRP